jgi:hypothetical protein
MDQKIKDLWNNNKLFFFLLLPIIIFIVLNGKILDLLIKSAKQIIRKVENSNSSAQDNELNARADQLKEDTDALGKPKPSIGEDWHKK